MTTANLKPAIKQAEGLRLTAYKDTVGVWTVGYGHAFVPAGTVWTQAQAEAALDTDIDNAATFLDRNLPWWRTLDDPRQDVMVEMAFNLGAKLLGFKNTLAFIKSGAYVQAASNMLQSKWAKQVGKRADRLAAQMRTGVVQDARAKPTLPKAAPAAATGAAAAATTVAVVATQVTWTPTIVFGAIALLLALLIMGGVSFLVWKVLSMSQALDDLTASVAALETESAAVVTAIGDLKAGTDEAALAGLKNRLDTVTANLTAAVAPTTA